MVPLLSLTIDFIFSSILNQNYIGVLTNLFKLLEDEAIFWNGDTIVLKVLSIFSAFSTLLCLHDKYLLRMDVANSLIFLFRTASLNCLFIYSISFERYTFLSPTYLCIYQKLDIIYHCWCRCPWLWLGNHVVHSNIKSKFPWNIIFSVWCNMFPKTCLKLISACQNNTITLQLALSKCESYGRDNCVASPTKILEFYPVCHIHRICSSELQSIFIE